MCSLRSRTEQQNTRCVLRGLLQCWDQYLRKRTHFPRHLHFTLLQHQAVGTDRRWQAVIQAALPTAMTSAFPEQVQPTGRVFVSSLQLPAR